MKVHQNDSEKLSRQTETSETAIAENIFVSNELVYAKPNNPTLNILDEKEKLTQVKFNTTTKETKPIQLTPKIKIVDPKKGHGRSGVFPEITKLRPISKFTFIMGLISLFCVFIFPLTLITFPLGLITIISGIIAFSKIKNIKSPDFKYAFIGFIIGILICSAWIGFLIQLSAH